MNYDVIVIGTGGMGSAALHHLARAGHRVLGLDRFPPGHDKGSSHGETRIIRKAYFEHPDYVPILQRAYRLWAGLEAESGEDLYTETGIVEIGPPSGELVPGLIGAARDHDLPLESIDPGEFSRRFPALTLPPGHRALYEKEAGFLRVERCVIAHLELARRHGAELIPDAEVIDWRSNGNDSVSVRTRSGIHEASALVIATGAWSGPLLAELGMPLRILRKHLHWFESDRSVSVEAGFPCFFFETTEGAGFYGFPAIDPLGLKIAEHSGGTEIRHDPLEDPAEPEPEDTSRIRSFLESHVSGVNPQERTRHVRCFYSMSPDGHFVIDRHPEHPQIAFAAGLSGHGFKFASAIGEALAALATGKSAGPEFDFLRVRESRESIGGGGPGRVAPVA